MRDILGFASRTTFADSGLLDGLSDFHSHILPGVDDGLPTLPDALATLRAYAEWGIREVWLTPHVMEDIPNAPGPLRALFAQLEAATAAQPLPGCPSLRLGAEHMLDALFTKRLAEGDAMPIIDGRHLLVETSYYSAPFNFESLLSTITARGFIPVLAHPERYLYMRMADYESLRARGVLLQLNLPSLVGAYGDEAEAKARALLERGMYALAGSDLHRLDAFAAQMQTPVRKSLVRKIKETIAYTR